MFFNYQKKIQTITFFILICLTGGYIFAVPPGEKTSAGAAKEKKLFSGVLSTIGDQRVLVNGNAAFNGMTILSGMEIKTGKNSGATINLQPAGIVELAAETSVKLVFKAEQIDLQVLSGKAKLTTFKTYNGSMSDTDGKILTTDPTLEISSVGDLDIPVVNIPPPVPAASTGLFGMGMLETLTIFGVTVGTSTLTSFAVSSANEDNGTVSRVRP